MVALWRVSSLLLNGDEHSDPERGAGLAGDRPHRHAQLCGAHDYAECGAVGGISPLFVSRLA